MNEIIYVYIHTVYIINIYTVVKYIYKAFETKFLNKNFFNKIQKQPNLIFCLIYFLIIR